MRLLFCYSVFSRRTKIGKAVPDLESQIGVSGSRKVDVDSRVSGFKDIAVLKNMEEYSLVDTLLKEDERSQYAMPEFVAECESLLKVQPCSERVDASPKKYNVSKYSVDVEELSLCQDSQQPPCHDHAKFSFEGRVSSYSQGTLQGEVSLSVGEGTISSDGKRPVVPRGEVALMGGSLGATHHDSHSDYSGERALHAQGFHEDDSAGCTGRSQEFAFATRYSDDGVGHCAMSSKSADGARDDDCAYDAHLSGAQVCEDEERLSGHASDPVFYAREVQKLAPPSSLEGATSPQVDVVDECKPLHLTAVEKLLVDASGEKVCTTFQVLESSQGVHLDEASSCFSRVKEWVDSIQLSEVDFGDEDHERFEGGNTFLDTTQADSSETFLAGPQMVDSGGANSVSLANAAVRSLHPSSTVAHLSGISLREVPSLGVFSSLRSLNLSANLIAHVPVNFLPRSLHSLDLSRNRIAQIEGFRELTRLRVLNLSYNRISRIGHGLANCTVIKELYLAGNKIGEIEGLHRLLKLAVLDLSFNKVTTSKALGQLAANYGSLLALNLIGNPILTNFSEDQLRKLVTTLVPHVAYLNRQPIKAISVREAALDGIARAALGTSQRHAKSRDTKSGRKTSGGLTSTGRKKLPSHQHTRALEMKVVTSFLAAPGFI